MADEQWKDSVALADAAASDSEGEDDLEKPDLRKLNESVVAASDWTAETIVRQLDRGNINLNPSFQRRDAWTPNARASLLNRSFLACRSHSWCLLKTRIKRDRTS
jgi:hypothetical protein